MNENGQTPPQEGEALERELKELFSSFDDVTATDELKERTLSYIFAELDEEEQEQAEDETPQLVVLEGAAKSSAAKRPARRWWLRAAAIVVAATLALSGVAYALPLSHVVISQDETSVDLGVNVFGVTVSVSCEDSEMQTLFDEADLRGRSYEEALENVLDTLDQHHAATNGPSAEVTGPFARGDSEMSTVVEQVVGERTPMPDAQTSPAGQGTPQQEPQAEAPAPSGQPEQPGEPLGSGTSEGGGMDAAPAPGDAEAGMPTTGGRP